jgi:NADPH:quinone reductase
MRFIDVKKPGSRDLLFVNEQPTPLPGPKEVLIQVKAAGVNHADLLQRAGNYPPPRGASPILGLEIAGMISQVGESARKWRVGEEVCALTNGGGYAEFCSVPEGQCLPLPHGMDFKDAASLPEAYFTVWSNLFMRTQLKSGESILIHGGTSGIGSCAIQLAKAFNAYVITTVGSEEKISFCKDLGADEIINYKEKEFSSSLRERRIDVILDIIGGPYFEKHLLLLHEEGRLVQVSCMQGTQATIGLDKLLSKRLTILGSTLRPQSAEAKARIAEGLLEHVWPLFEKKRIKSVVTASFALADAASAHQLMESGKHLGKIVLII